jgi:hypothetical protein
MIFNPALVGRYAGSFVFIKNKLLIVYDSFSTADLPGTINHKHTTAAFQSAKRTGNNFPVFVTFY